MGHPEAIAYLASPAVVAASAAKGVICGPDSLDMNALPKYEKPIISIVEEKSAPVAAVDEASLEPLLPGFPEYFEGPLVFAPQDNLTTDGMYPGKYTYQDDITPERQAEVVMGKFICLYIGRGLTGRKLRPRIRSYRPRPQVYPIHHFLQLSIRLNPLLGLQLWDRFIP